MEGRIGIYLHIPFCVQKCRYCDFCSYPARPEEERSAYVAALCREIAAHAPSAEGRTVDSIFVGGGTPSLLSEEDWATLGRCLRESYAVSPDCEFTAEANPATVDERGFCAMLAAGVNRLSLGMQSDNDGELALLGRIHRAEDLYAAVHSARLAGFRNLSLDLMLGIPDQTPASFAASLDAALACGPEHLSVYSLQIEEGTPFFRERDSLRLPDEEAEEGMQQTLLARTAEAGLRRYEISNFAREGYACRHNLRYWRREDYLGFGPAAHACLGGVRSYNPPDLAAYLADPTGVRRIEEVLTPEGREYEAIILGLRLTEGIDEATFAAEFGEGFYARYREALSPFAVAGLVRHEEGRTRFSDRGMRLSNTLLSDILASPAAARLFAEKTY